MKVAVLGCTHAGTAAVKQTLAMFPEARVTVYERNDNISFLSCGIALHVGGVVRDPQGLFYSSPEELRGLGVDTRLRHDIEGVDVEAKTVTAVNLETGERRTDTYDRLIITTGSWPVIPSIQGIQQENILLCKNYDHSKDIIRRAEGADKVVVVGAGYIGVELVEAFQETGKQVTLIDSAPRIMARYLDAPYTHVAEQEFRDRGVTLALDQTVSAFEGDGKVQAVVTDKGRYEADLVILCIGFRPNTDLFKGQLSMLINGAIEVDEYMQTSTEGVFAAGDCCAVKFNPTGRHEYIPLATNAVRMGTLAARNLKGRREHHLGTQGTSGIKIYDWMIATTGLTLVAAQAAGFDAVAVEIEDNDRPEFMPTYENVRLTVVYERAGGRLLGAQILSRADLTQMMNTVSVCIQNRMTVSDMAFVDFFFQPHFNKPWSLLNKVCLQALTNF